MSPVVVVLVSTLGGFVLGLIAAFVLLGTDDR